MSSKHRRPSGRPSLAVWLSVCSSSRPLGSHSAVVKSLIKASKLAELRSQLYFRPSREREPLPIEEEGAIVQSPQAVPISIHGADLESGEASSSSVTSDAGSAKAAADDVCAKSPRVVIDFVRRVSPASVGRSIDWDVVREEESSKHNDSPSIIYVT
uniref:Uncharacterized protein n=1 Tax=Oryza meridionalis TaxID=40149 RepID=A0A0E0EFT5_9ORYZ